MRDGALSMAAGLILGLVPSLAAQAQPSLAPPPAMAAPSRDPSAAPAGTYNIDLEHSAVVARVLHGGLSYSILRFGVTKGVLTWDPANPAAIKLSVTVDAKPHTDPIVYRFKPESAQFLNVEQFPIATFESTAVSPTGPGKADVQGRLTLMGVARPAVIHVALVGAGRSMQGAPSIGFTGTMVVKWSDYAKPLMPGAIGDEVTLGVEGEFTKG